jgi:hypothetical protein
VIVSHAPPSAFAPMTRPLLAHLGYTILEAEDFALRLAAEEGCRADLRIVDERQLAEVEDGDQPCAPIVLLTGREGVTGADPRIAGALCRPAGLHELFRVLQQILEDTPRSWPRVATHLRARCRSEGREWRGAVVSLSENGCLLRSPEPLPLGARLGLSFALPAAGGVELEGEVAYQLLPDLGVVFSGPPQRVRSAIAAFVHEALARVQG